jgi:hypothetical protein
VLSVATAVMWVRSFYVGDWLDFEQRSSTAYTIRFIRLGTGPPGRLSVVIYWYGLSRNDYLRRTSGPAQPHHDAHVPSLGLTGEARWDRADFDLHYEKWVTTAATTAAQFQLSCPHWLIVGFTLALPTYRLILWRKRTARGRCPICGYDLRATPQEGGALLNRCPECGSIPEPAGSATSA